MNLLYLRKLKKQTNFDDVNKQMCLHYGARSPGLGGDNSSKSLEIQCF